MFVLSELLLLGNSYFATHLPILYGGIIALVLAIGVGAYQIVRNFQNGDAGEAKVHRILTNLPSSYTAIRNVTLGEKGNIDEVVISPFGIWTLEVKNFKDGKITFENGLLCRNHYPLEGKPLKQAYAEAKALQEFIRESLNVYVPVTPVLVFTNYRDTMKFGFHEIEGVHVIGMKWLLDLIQKQTTQNRLELISKPFLGKS